MGYVYRYFRFDQFTPVSPIVTRMMKDRLPSPKNMAALLVLALLPEYFSSTMEDDSLEAQKLAEELIPARAQSRIGALGVILFFVLTSQREYDIEEEEMEDQDDNEESSETEAEEESEDDEESKDDEAFYVPGTVIGGFMSAAKARKYFAAVKATLRHLGCQLKLDNSEQLLDNLKQDLTAYAVKAKVKAEAAP